VCSQCKAIVVGLQRVVLAAVLIVKMMAQLASRNAVVVDHLLHPAAIVVGFRRVVLVGVLIAKMMAALAIANAVGADPLRLAHLAHQAQVGMPPTVPIQARTSMLIMEAHSSLELVGTFMEVGV